VPKPPKKDVTKLLALDGKSLRFLAKFQHPSVDDVNRRFLVTFYMADDTVAIFEKEEKDTGFPAGKFLERSKTKNPKTGKYFLPNDFHVGGLVIINSFGFELLHADEFTLKFMEEHKEMFHVANLDKVYADLKEDGLDRSVLSALCVIAHSCIVCCHDALCSLFDCMHSAVYTYTAISWRTW